MQQLTHDELSVRIDERGAQLCSLVYREHEYLWQGDPSVWGGQSPLLFPFVGRFTDGKYTVRGKEYHLPIHGFASVSDFEVLEMTDGGISFLLQDSESTLEVYPFRFRLQVTYTLHHNSLSVVYEVFNPSDEMMYFGIGGHPGFQVPMEAGLKFDDYYLDFHQRHQPFRVGHTETCFLNGIDAPFPLENDHVLRLSHGIFDDDAIVLRDVADTVTLRSDKGSRSVTMHYPQQPYLGLWHVPGIEAPYICIEPWTSLPSRQDIVEEFTCKSDLVRLPGGETYRTGWTVSVK